MSAFFSGSETSMLSLNRYRLKHLSKSKKAAKRASDLLQKPEKLIGMILIGNNLVNILASSIATIIAIRLFGHLGIGIATAISTVILTFLILVFAEVTPKTIAAYYPEKFAFPITGILKLLLKIFYPFVWLLNRLTSGLLFMIGLNTDNQKQDQLGVDELKTIVGEAGEMIPKRHQGMLLNILEIEQATVEDIMVPKSDIFAIDLADDNDTILSQLQNCNFTRVPFYKDDINNIVGILHMRNLSKIFKNNRDFDKKHLQAFIREPLYTPETTNLHMQLINFQRDKRRIAVVVDEYGSIMGLVTLEDILEEIVGEFTSNLADQNSDFEHIKSGEVIIQGSATVRDINKQMQWRLPSDGPKTLNGLIIEHLESFPDGIACVKIAGIYFEILQIKNNLVEKVLATYSP